MTTPIFINGRQYISYEHFRQTKSESDARAAQFQRGIGGLMNTAEGREAIISEAMKPPQVDRVEIAPQVGEFIDSSLNHARVDARVHGESAGQVNRQGGVELEVPASNIYGHPSVTPTKFFG